MNAPDPDRFGKQSAFAVFMDCSAKQVTRWKQEDRLVFNDQGQVDFLASRDKIEATSRASERLGIFSGERAAAREQIDWLEVAKRKLELDQTCGDLVPTADIDKAASKAGAMLRALVENMPYVLTPKLASAAGGDEARCRAILIEWGDAFLRDCSAAMSGMSTAVKV